MKRLTDERIGKILEVDGCIRLPPSDLESLALEVQWHRAARPTAALTTAEVEALRFAKAAVMDDREKLSKADRDDPKWAAGYGAALAALAKLIAQGGGK